MTTNLAAAPVRRRRRTRAQMLEHVRSLHLQWLEPYPGDPRLPWLVRCLLCDREPFHVLYGHLLGPDKKCGCVNCHYRNLNRDLAIPADQARAAMLCLGRRPTADYPGSPKLPWRSVCLAAGHAGAPSLNNMLHRRSASCEPCARLMRGAKRRLPDEQAFAIARQAGFEPQVPYVNSGEPWLSLCREGHETSPSLDNMRAGTAGCRTCARYSLRPADPAIVYVLTHPLHDAHKVGVAKAFPTCSVSRVADLRKRFGWECYGTLGGMDGTTARFVERRIHHSWGTARGFLSSRETTGHTETVSADVVSLPELWRQVCREFVAVRDATHDAAHDAVHDADRR